MLNAAKPPVWRAWLLLALACWACIAPGVALALPTASAPGFAMRGAETRVGVFCGNYGPARPVASSQVAELHQGKPAYGYETASGVHVYLYANANPVSGLDPSGHMTLSEIGVSSFISGFIDKAMAVYRIWGVYSKIQTILGAIDYVRGIVNLLQDPSAILEHLNVYDNLVKTGAEFGSIISREGIEDGFYTLMGNAPRITAELLRRPDLLRQAGNIKRAFIEMPTPYPGVKIPEFNIPTRMRIMGVPLFLRFFGRGSRGGRFIGMAVNGGKNEGPTQLWRMDWHPADGNEDWRDGRWHFHVGGERS